MINKRLTFFLCLFMNTNGIQKIYKDYQNIDLKSVTIFTHQNNLLHKIINILGESSPKDENLPSRNYPIDGDLLNYIMEAHNKRTQKISCFNANLIVDSIMWILLIALCPNNTGLLRFFKVLFFFNSVSNFICFFSQTTFNTRKAILYFFINILAGLLASLPEGTQMDNLRQKIREVNPLILFITIGLNTLNFITWYYYYCKLYPEIYNKALISFDKELVIKKNNNKLEAFIHKRGEHNNHMFMFLQEL